MIEVWYAEIRQYFPALKAYRWYEVAEKQRMAHIRDATLPSKVEELIDWLKKKCPCDKPDSASVVIVTSYETACHRALQTRPTNKKPGT